MSDLPGSRALKPSASQLPVSWYFDLRVFELEQKLLFAAAPGYVGHELMVPNVGDYRTLATTDHGKVLVRNTRGVELLSNVCRHRQAILLEGHGNAQNIVCPLHRWTYDMQGELLGAPHFPDNPCLNLGRTPLQNWRGLLFAGKRDVARDLASLSIADQFDFSGYMLDSVQILELEQNWKTFIEVYLEDYHVVPFHPGLGNFVTCDDLKWEIADAYSAQTVGVKDGFAKPGTPAYAKWHEALTRYLAGRPAKQGAIWFLYYPNVMIEWYPHVLVVSTLFPRSPAHTTNVVEFYYPEEIVLFERDFIAAEQAAYMETADEDDVIAKRMDRGRRLLLERGDNEVGPYQSPMEDGMMYFHEYLKRGLAGHV
ncbi:MAG TPA: aromatic ring-hydroxylating dioxygenase subunit alpha [Burkholderiales bacterium]|nr:aromatic ring-hydroxylating dioxygenase subunit alpha [Burkholderiales bacterium]